MTRDLLLRVSVAAFSVMFAVFGVLIIGHGGLFVASAITLNFLLFRDKRVLHPTNMLYAFYALYMVLPVSLFYVLELIQWEYILPWGKISDWGNVGPTSMLLSLATFLTLFFLLKVFVKNQRNESLFYVVRTTYIPFEVCILLLLILNLGLLLFVHLTGGLTVWLTDYSNTYVSGKGGAGWLNLILINLAHFVFFVCGLTYFSKAELSIRKRKMLIALLMFTFIVVCYFQGIKSRVPLLALMFFFPLLVSLKLRFVKGIAIFVFFVLFFMISMYFRSNGFYESFPMLMEYLLSYFNTYILLDNTINDMPPDYIGTLWFSMTKYTAVIFDNEAKYLDISYWLTDIYFPEMWANKATQQWPLEMEIYFNFGGFVFMLIPLLGLSSYYAFLYNRVNAADYCFYFIFIAEFVRLFTMLRGSILPWTLPLLLIFYALTYVFMKFSVRRVRHA